MKTQQQGLVDAEGRLVEKYRPALFVESSVAVEYWCALEFEEVQREFRALHKQEFALEEYAYSLFAKRRRKLDTMARVRHEICMGPDRITPVTTPLVILEVAEWNTRAKFKQAAAETVGAMSTERFSRKEVGDYIHKVIDHMNDHESRTDVDFDPVSEFAKSSLPSFDDLQGFGLDGILEVNVSGLTFDIQSFGAVFSDFAMRQVGLADIIHLATAQHLGCDYFASFDSDFKPLRGVIESRLGMVLVDSPQALLDLVKV